MMQNTKIMGGGMMNIGVSMLNDGFFEFIMADPTVSRGEILTLMDDMTKRGGVNVYNKKQKVYRLKQLKFQMTPPPSKKGPKMEPGLKFNDKGEVIVSPYQPKDKAYGIVLDGENLIMDESAIFTLIPQKLEVLADFSDMTAKWKIFNN
jgi:hypothetical protein